MIPFIDLPAQHQALEDELMQVFRHALQTAAFIGGPQVEAFEEEFARFCETRYCVGVNSGTDALRFALIAAGIGPGDEVITVPNTFIATAEAISQTGATPAFVDIDERTYNMDPQKLHDHLKTRLQPPTSNLKPQPTAVIPVHLYGQPADMDPILEIAQQHDLIVIEDACQAQGAEYYSKFEVGGWRSEAKGKGSNWVKSGHIGDVGCFSFYPGKNLGACGEAGAVTTDDEVIAQKVRMLRDHGQGKKYSHDMEGYNGRLDAIQAGILRVKLRHLHEWNEKRREHACYYSDLLAEADGVMIPSEPAWARAVYHLYVIRTQRRDELQRHLANSNISTGIHYPIPIHLQNAYSHLGYKKGDFPVSEKLAREILSLPMYPELTYDQQKAVAGKIKEFFAAK